MKIQFLGANRQVTGSRYYVEAGGARFLVDCGMFQEREFQGRNWAPPPVPMEELDAILLTHAHLDHSGLIPRAVRQGFRGTILCTDPSADIAEVILQDSAKIQLEDLKYKQKRHRQEGRKGKHPYETLYDMDDVAKAMSFFRPVRYEEEIRLTNRITVSFHEAGHILGSAMIRLVVTEDGKQQTIVFSGDIGPVNRPFVNDPTIFEEADTVILESTYGDRDHPEFAGPEGEAVAAEAIEHAIEHGGRVLVPAFAVERAQEVLYHIGRLVRDGKIPRLPVYLDSPMAVNVTGIFRRYRSWFDEQTRELFDGSSPLASALDLVLIKSVAESKALNDLTKPAIIVSSSGMCTGGRIKHHLIQSIHRPECSIVFVGYQARGTLGRAIVEGEEDVRIFGRMWPVRARVFRIEGFSGHADRDGLLTWFDGFRQAPARTFLTHGEEDAAMSLADELRRRHPSCDVIVPEYGAEYTF